MATRCHFIECYSWVGTIKFQENHKESVFNLKLVFPINGCLN